MHTCFRSTTIYFVWHIDILREDGQGELGGALILLVSTPYQYRVTAPLQCVYRLAVSALLRLEFAVCISLISGATSWCWEV